MEHDRVNMLGRPETSISNPEVAMPTPNRTITIRPLNHGYIITLGCQEFAIENRKKLTDLLDFYLCSPTEVERAWIDKNKGSDYYPEI